jgi:putative ABC transport system permease protein
MRWFHILRLRLRALTRGAAVDRELDEELRLHLDRLVEENLAAGMPPREARDAARRAFGPVTQITEDARESRGIVFVTTLAQDVRYGARLMTRTPGFAAAAILTVALGIAATTGMFSVVYGVVLEPLPYGDSDRLVNYWSTAPTLGLPRGYVAMANVYDFKARNHVFQDIAALRAVANFNLTGQGEPERLNAARVSANLFPLLRVSPLLGRTFSEDEDEVGHELVAVLSYGLWVRRFGADPSVVGRTILLNGNPHAVIGVMRRDFAFPSREYDIYTPLTFDPEELVNRMNYSYLAVARLKPGITVAQAQAEASLMAAQIEREHPREGKGIGAEIAPMLADTVASVRTPLYLVLGAVAAMLLIGCANLANLLLARAQSRQRELAMRAALGASRRRLILQSIAELVPMLAAGGTLGLGAAAGAIAAVVPLLPSDLPRAENIGLDWPVLVVAAATLAAIGVFVGVWPAVQASRLGVGAAAVDQSRGNSGPPRGARLRDGLVVAQIAATLWLLVSATLLMRSFAEVRRVNPGFNPAGIYTVHLAIPRSKYRTDRDVAAFADRLMTRVRALPDVVSVGMVNRLPLAGGTQTGQIAFEGIDSTVLGLKNVDYRSVTPDYFRTLEIPVVRGRAFTAADDAETLVAIIDDKLAKLAFPNADPIGHRVRIPFAGEPWLRIVGVVGHIRHDRLEEDVRPQIYFTYAERTQDRMALAARTRGEPSAVAASVVAAIRAVDPEQPVYDARTLDAVVDRSLGQRWLQTALLGAFASIALLLASVGVYGVIAFGVGQRTREFGIRLALGARRGEIVRGVLRRGVVLFAAGSALGLVAAAGSARVLGSLLFNVSGFDASSFAAATAVLFAVALAACALPARRAAGVDPSVALRTE